MVHILLAIIYFGFISLGLPDAVLGSAWPVVSAQLGAPLSSLGVLTVIIAAGTIVSSLFSDRITKALGVQAVCAISVGMTAVALLGYANSTSFIMLCLWSVPYGLGAGGIDAALNNYVALHYSSRHMSWLHCMWGVGATAGPYIMGSVLSGGGVWNTAFIIIFVIQAVLTVMLTLSRPIWQKSTEEGHSDEHRSKEPLSVKQILGVPGVAMLCLTFFCYCAIEVTTGAWASSYLVDVKGTLPQTAASFAAFYYLGITIGRAVSGFLTMRFNDITMIRGSFAVVGVGILLFFLPFGTFFSLAGLILIGLGNAPIYPCIIHSTPAFFGKDKSQAIIGFEMASAYTGIMLMPALFGLLAENISLTLYPIFLLVILIAMVVLFEAVVLIIKKQKKA